MLPIPEELLCGPFTLADALDAGLTRYHLRGSRFRRLFHGVYVTATQPDSLELRCDAAVLVLPDSAAFSHATAVALYRLPLPFQSRRDAALAAPIHVTVDTSYPVPQSSGIRGHVRQLRQEDIRLLRGRRVTSPTRTFLDLAAQYSRTDLVVLGDAMLGKRLVSTRDLAEAVAAAAGAPGCLLAQAVIPYLEPRSGSAPESVLRIGLIDGGLPRPEVNVDVFDEAGQWVARPDLLYRKERIAIEYEGDHHRTDRRQFAQDTMRDRLLAELGYVVIRLTARDVLGDIGLVVDSIRQVMRHQAAR